MDTLLSKLTDGLIDVSANGIPFIGGPFGEIQGILDKFGLDFNDMIGEFTDSFDIFQADVLKLSIERQNLFNLRPVSLPQFPNILQIGSKKPSTQYSLQLNNILWDKLSTTFPSLSFNGVKIPNIPSGLTFSSTFPRGKFPGEHILLIPDKVTSALCKFYPTSLLFSLFLQLNYSYPI